MVSQRKNGGIERIGKTTPDIISAGRKPMISEAMLASSWSRRRLDMISPMPSEAYKNKALTIKSTQ